MVSSDSLSQFKQFFSYEDEIKKIIDLCKIKSISDINKNQMNKVSKENKKYFTKISELKKHFPKKFEIKNFLILNQIQKSTSHFIKYIIILLISR